MSATAQVRRAGTAALARAAGWLRAHRSLAVVLGAGLLLRAALVPLTYGTDFGIWDLTATATLHGHDTYSHPPLPVQQAGPYAYFPLYLYILVMMKWLALHTGLPYLVLGKLPVVAGDVVVALALAAVLRRAGLGERACAVGAALFFLNPLVLYNGAFYGRFDSLCLATLLLAWRYLERPDRAGRLSRRGGERRWPLALWFGIAVTLKTFPIFLLPYLLLRVGVRRGLAAALAAFALPTLVSLPYLLHDARRFLYTVFVYDISKGPRQFSWQLVFLDLGVPERTAAVASYALLALFVLALLATARDRTARARAPRVSLRASLVEGMGGLTDPYAYAALAYTLFLLLSKVVYEQYFLWPLPFLAVLAVRDRARAAAVLIAVLSITGPLANAWVHPFGYRPGPALWLNALIAAVASVALALWRIRARPTRAQAQAVPSTRA